jgi:hypothetical protein
MKEIEKLAKEFAKTEGLKGVMGEDEPCYEAGFIAGFRKARELIIEEALARTKIVQERMKGSTYSHDRFPVSPIDYIQFLKKLGESEVTPT